MTVGFSRDLETIRRVALQARNLGSSENPDTRALAGMVEELARCAESGLKEVHRIAEQAEMDARRAKRFSMSGY